MNAKSIIALVAVVLVLVGVTLFFVFRKPSYDPKQLVGKWRDENSLIEYRADGTRSADYDVGVHREDRWVLEGDLIITENKKNYFIHRILSFKGDELVIQSMANEKKIYYAKRVP